MSGTVNTSVVDRRVPDHLAEIVQVTRDAVKEEYVQLQGRDGVCTAVAEPKRRTALIGAIVLDDLGFVVDCTRQRLVPRDPRFVVSEIE